MTCVVGPCLCYFCLVKQIHLLVFRLKNQNELRFVKNVMKLFGSILLVIWEIYAKY